MKYNLKCCVLYGIDLVGTVRIKQHSLFNCLMEVLNAFENHLCIVHHCPWFWLSSQGMHSAHGMGSASGLRSYLNSYIDVSSYMEAESITGEVSHCLLYSLCDYCWIATHFLICVEVTISKSCSGKLCLFFFVVLLLVTFAETYTSYI